MKTNIKKIFKSIALLLLCSLVFSAYVGTASAQTGTAQLMFSPTSQTISGTGVARTVNVVVNPMGHQIASAEILITYNPDVITVNNIVPGSFFTNSGVGSPIEIIKRIDASAGTIHYAIAFPLGSGHTSSTMGTLATISFTSRATGTSPLGFRMTGTPRTCLSGINAACVPLNAGTGSVIVSGSGTTNTPTRTITTTTTPTRIMTATMSPTRTNSPTQIPVIQGVNLSFAPTSQRIAETNQTGNFNVVLNPGGRRVASVELVIKYDPSIIRVNSISPGTFFTSAGVGAPVEVVKNINQQTGTVHYALGFPLGSGHSSLTAGSAAIINFTSLTSGTTSLMLMRTGSPTTQVSDINAVNILNSVTSGSVVVGGMTTTPTRTTTTTQTPPEGSRLMFMPGSQTIAGPDQSANLSVNLDPNGENVSSVELHIQYNPSIITVNNITPGAFFTSSGVGAPVEVIKNIDTQAGTIHYALGFPLGSGHFSSTAGSVASINFTSVANGISQVTFVRQGSTMTQVSDVNARNVLSSVTNGTIRVGDVVVTGDPRPTDPVPSGPVGACKETTGNWQYMEFPSQSGNFTAEFDVKADSNLRARNIIGTIGLSSLDHRTPNQNYRSMAALMRLTPDGRILVRNGSRYMASRNFVFDLGKAYHFRFVVNNSNSTYSVYVTPENGNEVQIANNFNFRSRLRNRNVQLRSLAMRSRGARRSIQVCNLEISSGSGGGTINRGPAMMQDTTSLNENQCTENSGDANGDGVVNNMDYNIWKTNYNTPTTDGPAKGDFDCSGFVDGQDYVIWLKQ